MEKRGFKDVLFNEKGEGSPSSHMAEKAKVIEALNSSESAEKALETSNDIDSETEMDTAVEKIEEIDEDYAEFVKKLAGVQKDISHLSRTCLIGSLWRGSVELAKLKSKLQLEWNFVKGDVQIVERTGRWFEFHFARDMEKELVWDKRPYHVHDVLLVLLPWKPGFDPRNEIVAKVELWIRIMAIPTEYVRAETITAILEYNKIRTLIKLDPHTEMRKKAKYARVCVQIRYATTLKGFVIVPDSANPLHKVTYLLWYEGVSEGCPNCAMATHQISECPLKRVQEKNFKIQIKAPVWIEEEKAGNSKTSGEERPVQSQLRVEGDKRKGKGLAQEQEPSHKQIRQQKPLPDATISANSETQEGRKREAKMQTRYNRLPSPLQADPTTGHGVPSSSVFGDIHADNAFFGTLNHFQGNSLEFDSNDLLIYKLQQPYGMEDPPNSGFLLQDVVNPQNFSKPIPQLDFQQEDVEDSETSYKSLNSKVSAMLREDKGIQRRMEVSATDSGKRRQEDVADDANSAGVKRVKSMKDQTN